MWFKRKPKNRRFERTHILDVKMRAQHTRAVRTRMATTAFALILGTSVACFVLWRGSEWALEEFVWRNSTFNIKTIDIQTDGIIPIDQIRVAAGVKEGDNLLAIDLLRMKRDLELLPLIQSAAVERMLPNTLRLRVIEREPVAQMSGFQAASPGGNVTSTTFYIDEAGYVMLPLDLARQPRPLSAYWDPLPTLTGVVGTELRPGKRVESPQLHAALRLVAAFGRSPMVGLADIKFIDISSPQTLILTTGQGNEITFGLNGIDAQLRRWRMVHDFVLRDGRAISTLDLSVSNNVPARWQEANVAPPPLPKPIKPSRYRKNNHV
jgi:cell division septal protein FtsQ